MITNNGFAAAARSLSATTIPAARFNGTLADGNNKLGLNKAGSGTFTLAGSNAYSGNTTVTQGILVATNTASLGNPTSTTILTVDAGGELQLPAGVAMNAGNVSVGGIGVTGSGAINGGTLNVLGNSVTMNASSGTAVISSPVALDAAAATDAPLRERQSGVVVQRPAHRWRKCYHVGFGQFCVRRRRNEHHRHASAR